jgi:hypothetical protein
MQSHRLLRSITTFVFVVLLFSGAVAQVSPVRYNPGGGLITDRLSPRQLKRWEAIERLALARGTNYQPLHPTLYWLWEWAENSGHAIYIELPGSDGYVTSTAGRFSIERCDPQGKRHVAVIQLYLTTIDQAYVGPNVIRADGLIPMEGLTKEERYAEVLSHELAHAHHILTDLQLTMSIEDLVERTNEMLLSHNARRGAQPLGPEMRWRIYLRDLLLLRVEAYAESIETAVWRELKASKKERRIKWQMKSN